MFQRLLALIESTWPDVTIAHTDARAGRAEVESWR